MSSPSAPTSAPLVVIADQDHDSRLILPTALRHAGYRCTPTPNGEEALAITESGHAALLITELYLPARGRPCLLRAIRDCAAVAPRVLVYTAYAMPEDRQWALDAGYDTLLYKPTPVRELLDVVGQLIQPA